MSFKQDAHNVNKRSAREYDKYKKAKTIRDAIQLGAYKEWLADDLKTGNLSIHEDINLPPQEKGADEDGIIYLQWLQARMKLLPKKGDLSLCKNWRAICLLDIASKIVSSIISNRLQIIMKYEGLEQQAGFCRGRGTVDGSFSTVVGLQKRKEHGLATWALFIDLVKAFDTIIREATFLVLRKFGIPDHLINLIIRLHTNATMDFKVGDIDTAVPSKIGVRQGSIEGPILFLIIFQAALETADWPVDKPKFYTRKNGVISGESWKRKTDKEGYRSISVFELWSSLFADDCALLFETRDDLICGANYIFNHFKRFGLQMHVGRGKQASKTEAMYFPVRESEYNLGDTSNFTVAGDGFISFTKIFKYLGSHIHYSLTSTPDIDIRIKDAAKVFGALRKRIFGDRHVDKRVKGKLFISLCTSILLFGSECWTTTEQDKAKLRTFYNRSVRMMCRITMRHTIKHHIKTSTLLQQLQLEPFDIYYERRLLRWAGHVARMDTDRLPRQLLTSWVPHPRLNGGQKLTWGNTLIKALKSHNIPITFAEWSAMAQDRHQWKKTIKNKHTITKEKHRK